MRWTETYKLLEPFLLLLATAILTGYLAPKITQRWQKHQKALELKTTLVSEINENVLHIVMAIQFAEMGAHSQTQEEFDEAYSNWEVKRAKIGATLRSYFPRTKLVKDWDEFSEIVVQFYALTGMVDRQEQVNKLKEYFDKYFDPNAVSWETLANFDFEKGRVDFEKGRESGDLQQFMQAWDSLRKLVIERKDTLVQGILATRMVFFGS